MNEYSPKQSVELFHLLFMDQLGRKLDKHLYALKGGCNMRYFFKSIRYSEDIDIDVQNVSEHNLAETVENILESKSFRQILQTHGIAVSRWTAPKQTATTQRWKLALNLMGLSVELPTKIEFSRRGMDLSPVFEAVDPILIGNYQLGPIMLNHYDAESTLKHKIGALVGRRATQARDLFDIYLLISRGGTVLHSENLPEAREKAFSIPFHAFKSQVLSYLHPDSRSQYDSELVWDGIVLKVVEAFEEGES